MDSINSNKTMHDISAERILIVEDDEDILNLLEYNLTKAGLKIMKARDGRHALKVAKGEMPDLILLDLMLPELDGIEVCKILKRDDSTGNIPVLMITAKGEEVDRVVGLEIGAEDYIVKPFSPRELVLRVKAILKRVKGKKTVKAKRHG
ncbi:MAG: response regulator, partial [Thermodesulfobacteriota bacterium]